MANISCDAFTSINAAIAQANAGQLNITSYVAACPDVCTLAWGTGNPDLSGIGANISYILQAILTFIFGPLFCWVYAHRERWKFSDEAKGNLRSLQATFHDISAQFSIPVAAAAVVRFLQHAPFYELAFLRSLTTLQFLSLLSSSVAAGVLDGGPGAQRITVLVFYGLLEFALYLGLIGHLRTSKASWETLSALGSACTAYGRIAPWIKYIPPPSTDIPHATFEQYHNPIFLLKHPKLAFAIIGLFLAGILALVLAGCLLLGLWLMLVSGEVWVLGSMSLAFSVAVVVETVRMERTRNVMKNVTGAEFQDNQWGFGQVIAAFLWVPLFLQIFYNLFLIIVDSCSRNIKPIDEAASASDEKTPPVFGDEAQTKDALKTHLEEKAQAGDAIEQKERDGKSNDRIDISNDNKAQEQQG